MYCPSCGSEERQLSQFCRACGTDLRVVRNSLEHPDAITQSAVSAREHIGMAVADQIRQMKSAKELSKMAQEILPTFENFLESPEEKRLRRIRAGVITAAIGLGGTLAFVLAAMGKGDLLAVAIPFFVMFVIGLGIIINGMMFTLPSTMFPGDARDALEQRMLDASLNKNLYEAPTPANLTNELGPSSKPQQVSITEHTTHHLNTSKP